MKFANFRGRSLELVPEPGFACRRFTRPLKKGVPELTLHSFPPHFSRFGLPDLLLNINWFCWGLVWSKLLNQGLMCSALATQHATAAATTATTAATTAAATTCLSVHFSFGILSNSSSVGVPSKEMINCKPRHFHKMWSWKRPGPHQTCKLGALQSGSLRGICKVGDFYPSISRFSTGNPREQAHLRKSKTPRELPEKWTFLSLAFYNAPNVHTVDPGKSKVAEDKETSRKRIQRETTAQDSARETCLVLLHEAHWEALEGWSPLKGPER